jgi:hypothetical protein
MTCEVPEPYSNTTLIPRVVSTGQSIDPDGQGTAAP